MSGFTKEDIHKFHLYHNEIVRELTILSKYKDVSKDILIVVHNELDCLKSCISSIQDNTDNYNIFIWDNGSEEETAKYIETLDVNATRSEENLGFIVPNNRLIEKGSSEYVILLNSDTIVRKDWDKAMISVLQQGDFSQVGYAGGILDENGKGGLVSFGLNVDYICGWCFCIPRSVFNEFGLFDEENLNFAYCEDSDFSLRLKEAGRNLYALHLGLVTHLENRTIKNVAQKRDVRTSFDSNHNYIRTRWRKYLSHKE